MTRHTIHRPAVVVAAVLLTATVALPTATARTVPGDPGPLRATPGTTTLSRTCVLERVDRQLVRCDDLTGNGVPAPAYIPARG